MTRCAIRVREAATADIPTIVALGDELRQAEAGRRGVPGLAGPPPAEETMEDRYGEVLADARRRVVLAVGEDEQVLGMAVFTRTSASALVDVPGVQMSHVVVAQRHRRKGAGRALVAAAAAYAEEVGLDQVVVGVYPNSREVNRFYARLGFAPLVVRRVASAAALRRRLAGTELRSTPGLRRRYQARIVPLRRAGLPAASAGSTGLQLPPSALMPVQADPSREP